MGAKLGGSGGGKYEEEANSSINVTPFVDVMLVLLIIFMVAAPLAAVTVKVELPPRSRSRALIHPSRSTSRFSRTAGSLFKTSRPTWLRWVTTSASSWGPNATPLTNGSSFVEIRT